jgi:hypothetical protein
MNTEKLLRLLFPKTIKKIEQDIAHETYRDICGNPEDAYPDYDYEYQYDEEYEMLQAELFEQERIADEEYRQTLDLGLLQDEEQIN